MNDTPHTATRASVAQLGETLCELAARVHAGMAELTRMAAAFDDAEGWGGWGVRSCTHWLSINAGFDLFTGDELLRVGHALTRQPRLAAAFSAGELSFDKVRAVSRVATPADEEILLEIARQASGSQLARICRGYRRVLEANAREQAEAHLARRGMWAHWEDDGMLRLRAVLPPEDGALLLAALEAIVGPDPLPPAQGAAAAVPDPAYDSWAARRADALVALCSGALGSHGDGATAPAAPAAPRLVVHVDVGVLTGAEPEGRCHLEDGPALSAAAARRLGCDAEVVAVTEREGLPIDVGRAKRVVSARLRRALHSRDRGCRFPGCAVPARLTHAHHVAHWASGGPTALANLASLCGFHHRRLHDGVYSIATGAEGDLRFATADGRTITVRRLRVADDDGSNGGHGWPHEIATIRPETPRALAGGERCDLRYVVDTVIHACEHARIRAAPGP
ncbi:MAG TPA: DUF222 domain-containing protein [Candidatus Dormibacteraeota bacterium]